MALDKTLNAGSSGCSSEAQRCPLHRCFEGPSLLCNTSCAWFPWGSLGKSLCVSAPLPYEGGRTLPTTHQQASLFTPLYSSADPSCLAWRPDSPSQGQRVSFSMCRFLFFLQGMRRSDLELLLSNAGNNQKWLQLRALISVHHHKVGGRRCQDWLVGQLNYSLSSFVNRDTFWEAFL